MQIIITVVSFELDKSIGAFWRYKLSLFIMKVNLVCFLVFSPLHARFLRVQSLLFHRIGHLRIS